MEVATIDWQLVALAIIAVIEVIFSVIPTSSNWSILDLVYKLLRRLVPNNAPDGKGHQ